MKHLFALIAFIFSTHAYSGERFTEILWDANIETAQAYTAIVNDCHKLPKCLQMVPPKYNSPMMRVTSKKDYSKYDHIEFFIKTTKVDAPIKLSLAAVSRSNPIDVKNYLAAPLEVGKFIKVRIPMKDLETNGANFASRVYGFYFSPAGNNIYSLTVDEMLLVKGPEEIITPVEEEGEKYVKLRPLTRHLFGCDLNDTNCTAPSLPENCSITQPISGWPFNSIDKSILPVAFTPWRGPYANKAGYDSIKTINKFFTDGNTLGLQKEKFKSFDALINVKDGKASYIPHSTIDPKSFPGLQVLDASVYFDRTCVIEYNIYTKIWENRCSIEQPVGREICKLVFEPRVNYAVRSLGIGSEAYGTRLLNIADYNEKNKVRAAYFKSLIDPVVTPPVFSDTLLKNHLNKGESQRYYRYFYENNVLFSSPSIRSLTFGDHFTLLTPFHLTSNGASGTDSVLLNPIMRASASIPKDLKLRIMNSRMLTPTLIYLFKSSLGENYSDPSTHFVAYKYPEAEAKDAKLANNAAYDAAPKMPAPVLDKLIKQASELSHIPPVARLKIHDVKVTNTSTRKYFTEPFMNDNVYIFHGALRKGEDLELIIDLWDSWVDSGKEIVNYTAAILRGPATITQLKKDGSVIKVKIPYTQFPTKYDSRTDIVLYVNDGKYDSAPAYISIKHIQPSEEAYYFK